MKRINCPDRSYIDRIFKDTDAIIGTLNQVSRDDKENINNINQLFRDINSRKVDTIVDNTTVENFSLIYPDIKANTLKNNGFKNIGDLSRALESNIPINGIGDITRERIKNYINSYKRDLSNEVLFNFDIEQKDSYEEELLKCLYKYKVNGENASFIDKILDNYAHKMQENKSKIRTGLFWRIKWFFYPQSKKESIIETINNGERILEEINELNTDEIVSDYYSNKKTDINVWDEFKKDSASFYASLESIVGTNLSQDEIYGSLQYTLIKEIESISLNKENLTASLRGWQEFGAKYTICQKRVLIGDEMGLGKTIEAIAVMAHLKSEDKKHFFVVCPASIIINWVREVEKHSNLVPYRVHGNGRDAILENWIKYGGVGITSYDTARALNFPEDLHIDLLVSDEAHYIKNKEAKRSRVVYNLTEKSEYIMYMTGTPIENNVHEMLNLIERLQPDIVKDIYEKPYLLNKELFKEVVAPVYIRRNRKDVLMELPDLTQVEEWVEFGSGETRVYKQYVSNGNFMGMRRAGFSGKSRRESPKLNRLLELVDESIENGNKVIIFSFFRSVISKVHDELEDISVEPITGSINNKKRQDLIDEFSNSDEKMVLISQIQAGGVGLNIQSASTIIFCEPQIKPSLETQAISRAYRMGQIKNVFVYRLLTENSVDELMMEMLGNKQYVFNTYAKESYITDGSLHATDTRDQSVIKQIIQKEKERLGM